LPSKPSSASPDEARRSRFGLGALVLVAVLALVAVAVIAMVRAGSGGSSDDATAAKVSKAGVAPPGSVAPDFSLPALRSSGTVRLSQLRGTPVIVNFWASWCVPCRKEFPLFRATQAKYRTRGLKVIGITYKDLSGDARAFAKEQHANWTLAEGGAGDPVGKAYGVRAIPQTFFLDRDGVISARFYGAPSGDRLDAEVRKILRS
jgi:cytochrome c biogenesis protein CcmG, thiol:disulfide interchange protein DsbE